MQEHISKYQVLLLAGLTGLLYLCGLLYLQQFLAYWGIEETLFNLPFERMLFQGFLGTAPWWIKLLLYLVTLAAGSLTITFLNSVQLRAVSGWLKQRKEENRGNDRSLADQDTVPLRSGSIQFFFRVIVAIVFFGTALVLGQLSETQGREAAERQNQVYLKGDFPKVHLYHRRLGEIEGYPIICSDKFCAFWHDEIVSVLPQSDILRMERDVRDITHEKAVK